MQPETVILAIGIAASALSAFCMLPQLIKIAKEKAAENISIPMLAALITGLCLWLTYGILKKDYIIVLSNAISVGINIAILVLSVVYKGNTMSSKTQ
ncbi:MAG TPA: SemiSWEET family transporter [Chitinophagales bacterium]|nr:SemiSWEET family transporter [Chitinophagales bacterium]